MSVHRYGILIIHHAKRPRATVTIILPLTTGHGFFFSLIVWCITKIEGTVAFIINFFELWSRNLLSFHRQDKLYVIKSLELINKIFRDVQNIFIVYNVDYISLREKKIIRKKIPFVIFIKLLFVVHSSIDLLHWYRQF